MLRLRTPFNNLGYIAFQYKCRYAYVKQIGVGGNMKGARKILASAVGLCLVSVIILLAGYSKSVNAEGTAQLNDQQALNGSTTLYADITTVGETINISSCGNGNINIWNTNGTPSVTGDDTQVVTNFAFTANLACGSPIPDPITNPYRYTPASTGTYRFTISVGTVSRYDFTVTPNNSTNPSPSLASGRIWSYSWSFSTGSFAASAATDADMYILVPGANSGENFVWKLDLNKFSGNGYVLSANSLGLNAPYSGLSAAQNVSSVTPEFPIYIGYPGVAGSANSGAPTISSPLFIDSANEDNIFSPGITPGVQDTGNFKFNSNVANANYAITIDTNQDGVYGTGDRLLLGKASLGANSVTWDGNYPNGSPVPAGVYHAQIQLRLGEYHFIAQDVETSGGTEDGGTTWANGLTIYQATGPNTTANTTVYWDDLTELSAQDYPTANVPNGVTSGSTADNDHNGRADGFHTWGTFTSGGVGNNNNIDTYVYGPTDTKNVTIAVATSEAGDSDGVAASVETGAANNGDGNGDSTVDFLQDLVTSLPNSITGGGAYNTIQSSGCTNLSNVSVVNESSLSPQDATYSYPNGLARFHINCSSGATTTVTVYYDQQYVTTDWLARAFSGSAYANVSGASFSTVTIGGTPITKLTFSVTDGGPLDADGTANGVIDLTVGPGVLPPDLSTSSKGVSDLNGGSVELGDTLRYAITVVNSGGSQATGVSVTDAISSYTQNVTNVSMSNCGSATNGSTSSNLSVTGITVNVGTNCVINFDVTVKSSAPNAASITNTATISAATQGGSGATPSSSPLTVSAPVTENDGVDSTTESSGPNSGDSNNDGLADSQQNNVTTLPNSVSGRYAVLQTDGCTGNSNVTVGPASTTAADSTYSYPAGLMAFSINCSTPGSTSTVTQYYFGSYDASKMVARKYDSVTHVYTTVSGAVITNVTVGGGPALKIVYQITDGSTLDEDGTANGVIVDPVGPAVLAATSSPNTGLRSESNFSEIAAVVVGLASLSSILYTSKSKIRQYRQE